MDIVLILQEAKTETDSLEKDLKTIDSLTNKIVKYFCENEKSFKLDECIENLNTFCENIQRCKKVCYCINSVCLGG